VTMVLIASMALVLTSSGISMDGAGIEKIMKPFSYLISNSNFPGSDNVLIKSFLAIEDPELDTQKIARDIHWSVNEQRDLHGLNPVAWNPSLSEIAKKHSQDMIDRIYYSHYSPEGKDVADRYEDANFKCEISIQDGKTLRGGENLALITGLEEPEGLGERIVESWMLSPDHKKNLLYNYYENEGIGVIVFHDELYVTQNFC